MISLFPCDESCRSSRVTQISSLREELPHFTPAESLASGVLQFKPRQTSHPAKIWEMMKLMKLIKKKKKSCT